MKLRAAKAQSAVSTALPSSSNKAVAASEWQQQTQQSAVQQAQQQTNTTHVANENFMSDMGEEVSAIEDRGPPSALSFLFSHPSLISLNRKHTKQF